MSASTDRNLLFGLLALQMDFVTRDELLDAMQGWLFRKQHALALILRERGVLTTPQVEALAALLEQHIAKHGDARQSLASLRVETPVRESLSGLADAEVQEGVASLVPDTVGDAAPSLPAAPPLPSGNGASRYRKLRPHAVGGLGEVSVALDEELKREVALKEILSQHADRADFRARFVREAEITGNLEHPGIVPVYGLGAQVDGRPCYAMRFIRGESMQDAITRFHRADEGRRDPSERELALRGLLGRFVAVCNAVAYAHSRGVVHRDLKPANVMLGEYGETLVVDWGLAKVLDLPDDVTSVERPVPATGGGSAPTEMGRAIGTPAYMPPEQARGEHDKVDHRSDVFALGATLYGLLTGRPPYQGQTAEVLTAAAEARFEPARRVNARVPAALSAVCARAMAARPEDRYATARQLAADVERFLADEPVTAMPEPVREKARRWAKKNRTLMTSGLVLLVASVVGLGGGLAAVRAEQAHTEAARDKAEEAEGIANARLEEVKVNLSRAVKAENEAKGNLATARSNLRRAEENDRQARGNLEQAGENFRLARQVVNDSFGVARDHPLLAGPLLSDEMRQLKRLLLEKALPFYQQFRAARPKDSAVGIDLLDQHYYVGYIQMELGKRPEALDCCRMAEEVARTLLEAPPGVPEYQCRLAGALTNLGHMQYARRESRSRLTKSKHFQPADRS